MGNKKQTQEIIPAVKRAFPIQPIPDFTLKQTSHPIDSEETSTLEKFFCNKKWSELPLDAFTYSYDVHPLICFEHYPKLWAYYLPAFIIRAMEYDDGTALFETIIGSLNWIGNKDNNGKIIENPCISQLTKDQRRAIALYVRHIISNDPSNIENIQVAYDVFWSNYLMK